jgi:hypothetical protein
VEGRTTEKNMKTFTIIVDYHSLFSTKDYLIKAAHKSGWTEDRLERSLVGIKHFYSAGTVHLEFMKEFE